MNDNNILILYAFTDLSLLLEQDPNGRFWQLPRLPLAVRGEPGRLQALDGRGTGADQGGEAAEGPRQEAEDLRKQVHFPTFTCLPELIDIQLRTKCMLHLLYLICIGVLVVQLPFQS